MSPEQTTLAIGASLALAALVGWFGRQLAVRGRSIERLQAEANAIETALLQSQTETRDLKATLDTLRKEHETLRTQTGIASARQEERERGLQEQLKQLESNKAGLKVEFENLSREFLDARQKELATANEHQVGALLKPLAEKIDGFQTRVNQIHGDWSRNSATLAEQIRQLEKVGLIMSADASNLTQALKGDKKLAGNWGEAQLERTLELAGLVKGEHYQAQASFKDEEGNRYLPDFVVNLPGDRHLILDSKVSLVDYESAISAASDEDRLAALERHARAVKQHADDLAEKAYDQLPGLYSPDFVLMFMPVEPAYIEVMKHHRDLFSHAYRQGVVMVSHSTLMPILRTVSNLWMVERSNAEAREISNRAGEIFNSVVTVAERLQALGTSLQTANKRYNDTVRSLVGRQGLQGKVDRFQRISQKASKQFPDALASVAPDTDAHLLDGLTERNKTPDSD